MSTDPVHDPTILVDCRWSGNAGVGRVTDYLLAAWSEHPPAGKWILWGPESIAQRLWPGATHVVGEPPRAPLIQELEFRRLPAHDLAFFIHQIHPLSAKRYVTMIHDTIPLRWGGSIPSRLAKRAYLTTVARRAEHVITVSEFSRRCIESDLGMPAEKLTVLPPPQDRVWEKRIREKRSSTDTEPLALYVGRYARHKNVERLVRVFPRTQFAKSGGKLRLVGGEPSRVEVVRAYAAQQGAAGRVTVSGRVAANELDDLYACAQMLIIPSYEEGYGLPAYEALSFGLPVCASTGGALADVAPHAAATFDPYSDGALGDAIDMAVAGAAPGIPYGHYTTPDTYGDQIARQALWAAGRT